MLEQAGWIWWNTLMHHLSSDFTNFKISLFFDENL